MALSVKALKIKEAVEITIAAFLKKVLKTLNFGSKNLFRLFGMVMLIKETVVSKRLPF